MWRRNVQIAQATREDFKGVVHFSCIYGCNCDAGADVFEATSDKNTFAGCSQLQVC